MQQNKNLAKSTFQIKHYLNSFALIALSLISVNNTFAQLINEETDVLQKKVVDEKRSEFNQKVKKYYSHYNNDIAIACNMNYQYTGLFDVVPTSSTQTIGDVNNQKNKLHLARSFTLKSRNSKTPINFDLKFLIDQSNSGVKHQVRFHNSYEISGTSKSGFFYGSSLLTSAQSSSSEELKKIAGEDVLNNLICQLTFLNEDPITFNTNSSDYFHISVHPVQFYGSPDFANRVNKVMSEKDWPYLILLESSGLKPKVNLSNYVTTRTTGANEVWRAEIEEPKQFKTFENLRVAPAGYIKFNPFPAEKFPHIIYTGGYHNYCMSINIHQLIYAYLKSEQEQPLEITFLTDHSILSSRGNPTFDVIDIDMRFRKMSKISTIVDTFFSVRPDIKNSYFNNYATFIRMVVESRKEYFQRTSIEMNYDDMKYTNTIFGKSNQNSVNGNIKGSNKSIILNFVKLNDFKE